MFKVCAVEEKSEQERICAACNAEFVPKSLAYAAYEVESPDSPPIGVIAVCQFSLAGEHAVMHTLCPAPDLVDDEAVLILGFTALDFLRRCGFVEVTADASAMSFEYANRLGFGEKDGRYSLDLTAGYGCAKRRAEDAKEAE